MLDSSFLLLGALIMSIHHFSCRFAKYLPFFLAYCVLGTQSKPVYADDKSEINELIESFDNLWIDKQSYAELDMKVKTSNYERDLRMMYWGKGADHSLVRITYPPKEKGVSTLKAGKDVYNYVPKIARTTKITDALLSQSWMGSHFTNSDLMRTVSIRKEYDIRVADKKKKDGVEVWVLECNAKPNIPTLYKKLVIQFNRKNRMPLEQKVYDKSNSLLRTFTYLDVKDYSGKNVPSRVRVTPEIADQKGEFTEVLYTKIDRHKKFGDDVFSLSNLTEL